MRPRYAPEEQQFLTMVGALIRARRQELGLTQLQLAMAVGVDVTYISRIERGWNFTILKGRLIARALGWVVLEDLVDGKIAVDELPGELLRSGPPHLLPDA